MGTKFFGIDIQAEIAKAIPRTAMPNFVLTKKPLPTDDTELLSGPGTPGTPVDYPCHGAVLDFKLEEMDLDSTKGEPEDAQGVVRGDKKILVIAKPLADAGVFPEPDDTITVGAVAYRVVNARTDAATAKWICHCRGR